FFTSMNKAAKVTVVHARMGELAFGTSPGKATVSATLRSGDDKTMEMLKKECLRLAKGVANTYSLRIEHKWSEEFLSTVNEADAVELIRKSAHKLGLDLREKEYSFEWSEDFGRFTKQFPGAMFGL